MTIYIGKLQVSQILPMEGEIEMTAWGWLIMSGVFLIAGILAIVFRTAAIFGGSGRGAWGILAGIIAFVFSGIAAYLGIAML